MKNYGLPELSPKAKRFCDNMVKKWGAGVVARGKIGEFSGGLMTSKYMARLDNTKELKGVPLEIKLTLGKKVCYLTEPLAHWLASRTFS